MPLAKTAPSLKIFAKIQKDFAKIVLGVVEASQRCEDAKADFRLDAAEAGGSSPSVFGVPM